MLAWINRNWKAPTWKGLTGLLLTLSGIVTALTVSPGTLPRPIEQWVIAGGVLLIAVERVTDAMDNKAALTAAAAQAAASEPTGPIPVPGGAVPPTAR